MSGGSDGGSVKVYMFVCVLVWGELWNPCDQSHLYKCTTHCMHELTAICVAVQCGVRVCTQLPLNNTCW